MAVPKKRTSISKKNIRKNFWKKKGYWTALKAFSLAQSIFTGKSKSFVTNKMELLDWNNIN
uniref:ribosomal protein L32 n=1 Tax=Medicago granadensis TaxID=70947 RepID=UPI00226CC669|nr:ribosomal protein L32 [Medicago granadensis]UZC30970.1 ribosomal protein L32 [Medicago granadensis]